jgi:hypothetical protein
LPYRHKSDDEGHLKIVSVTGNCKIKFIFCCFFLAKIHFTVLGVNPVRFTRIRNGTVKGIIRPEPLDTKDQEKSEQ